MVEYNAGDLGECCNSDNFELPRRPVDVEKRSLDDSEDPVFERDEVGDDAEFFALKPYLDRKRVWARNFRSYRVNRPVDKNFSK